MPTHSAGARAAALFVALWLALGASAGEVHPSAAETRPLATGTRIPSAKVETLDGGRVDLAELAGDSGVLLVFYRGGW